MDPERIERGRRRCGSDEPQTAHEAERQERNESRARHTIEDESRPTCCQWSQTWRLLEALKIECSGALGNEYGSTLTESHSICLPPSSSREHLGRWRGATAIYTVAQGNGVPPVK